MIPSDKFYSRILPLVQGCPEPLLEQAVRDSAIEFCRRSLAIQEDLEPEVVHKGVASYDLFSPSANNKVSRILSVKVGDNFLEPLPQTAKLVSATGSPTHFTTSRTGSDFQLVLYPTPVETDVVTVRVALEPTMDATRFDDDLYDQWSVAIVSGALSRIQEVPAQSYSNENKAARNRMIASKEASRAKIESYYGRARGTMSIKQRPLVR